MVVSVPRQITCLSSPEFSMNRDFVGTIIETKPGGKGGGGASVTELGKEVIQRYRDIEDRALASVENQVSEFGSLLNKKADN